MCSEDRKQIKNKYSRDAPKRFPVPGAVEGVQGPEEALFLRAARRRSQPGLREASAGGKRPRAQPRRRGLNRVGRTPRKGHRVFGKDTQKPISKGFGALLVSAGSLAMVKKENASIWKHRVFVGVRW